MAGLVTYESSLLLTLGEITQLVVRIFTILQKPSEVLFD
jgi:hypothetical protein